MFCQAPHDYRPFIRAAPDAQLVADMHDPTRFSAGGVDVNLSASNGLRGEGAGLEEARRPEPLVDPRWLIGFFNRFIAHRVIGTDFHYHGQLKLGT